MNTIAVVDDEEDLLNAVKITLRKENFDVKTFSSGEELFKSLKTLRPDAFILDIMLPGGSGFDICRRLRGEARFKRTPVIFLSARADEFDKVLGLELGADDYVTKPFSPKELAARVKAVLRRADAQPSKSKELSAGLSINKENMEVFSNGKRVELTLTEFKILELLTSKKGRVFTRDEMLDYVWGEEKVVSDRTIDVHIKNLREKLGKQGSHIQNIRSVGYKFDA